MISTASLTGSHLRTHQSIFQHPLPHNLGWRDVHALLRHLGQLEEQPNGNWKATRNGHSIVLHTARTKDVATPDEVMALRHFLERSDTPLPDSNGREAHLLLVIDHHEARLYRTEVTGGFPARILPHPPEDFFRHAHHSKDFTRGQEKPDPNSFFEPVAKALAVAGQILIFGAGTGMGSEMEQFIGWLKIHHPELAERIIGSVVVDQHHLTEGEVLAKAQDCYASFHRVSL